MSERPRFVVTVTFRRDGALKHVKTQCSVPAISRVVLLREEAVVKGPTELIPKVKNAEGREVDFDWEED